MRTILALLLLAASIVGVVVYVVPTAKTITQLRNEATEYNTILTNARKLEETRDELLKRLNALSPEDRSRLETMLPGSPENVAFILEASALAEQNGVTLQNVKVVDSSNDRRTATPGQAQATTDPYGVVTLELTMIGQYPSFTNFLRTLERSLRVVDVTGITFVALDDRTSYQYTVTVRTYWLRT